MEILVVLSIAGILIGVAIPTISTWVDNNALSGVSGRIFNDLQYCRQRAISQNQYYALQFASTAVPITYNILYGTTCSTAAMTTDKNITIPESLAFHHVLTYAAPVIFFDYHGMSPTCPESSQNGRQTVTITNALNNSKTITVSLAGQMVIQ